MTNGLLESSSYICIWLIICAFPHTISGSPSSYMTLQPLHSEFPYKWGKFFFLFYQCRLYWDTICWIGLKLRFWNLVHTLEHRWHILKTFIERHLSDRNGTTHYYCTCLTENTPFDSGGDTLVCVRGGGGSQFGRRDRHSGTLGIV